MYIFLNGKKQNVTDLVTVDGLLAHLKLESRKVAVELNKKSNSPQRSWPYIN